MKSSMIEQPRNNPNTTKTTNPSVPAPELAPVNMVMGPDREIISKNTSSTISTSSEQVDPMTGKSPDVKQLSHSVDFEAPTIKEHGRDGEHPFEPEVQGDQDRGYPLLRTVSEHLPVEYLYLSMNDKKKLSRSVDSTSLNCRDSQSATLCPTQVSKWGAGGRGCGSGRGHECTPVAQYEIAFENIFSVKIQDFKTDNEKSKHSLSTMIPGQLEAFWLKEFCNSIPKYILALKTDEQRMKIEKISNSFRLKTDKGKPSQISTYMAYHWSYDDKISSFEAYAVTYDKISTYEAYMDAYDDNAASCA